MEYNGYIATYPVSGTVTGQGVAASDNTKDDSGDSVWYENIGGWLTGAADVIAAAKGNSAYTPGANGSYPANYIPSEQKVGSPWLYVGIGLVVIVVSLLLFSKK